MKMYRLMSTDIRDAQSPQDEIVCLSEVTLSGTSGTVATPFKEGTKIAYCILHTATVSADGSLSFDTGSDQQAGVLVLGKNQARMNDMLTWE